MRLATLKPKVGLAKITRLAVAAAPTTWGKEQGGRPWRRLVEAVKRRDQWTCQSCGRITEDGECDHIVPISLGGSDDMSNLQWLCKEPCHREKTAREAKAAQRGAGGG
jgi:5-methylcytosine-specific restriction protein A